jgi:hypothetical protein
MVFSVHTKIIVALFLIVNSVAVAYFILLRQIEIKPLYPMPYFNENRLSNADGSVTLVKNVPADIVPAHYPLILFRTIP